MTNRPYEHSMMAKATHDEHARQEFLLGLKIHMEDEIYPGDELVYKTRALPSFERENGRLPKDRHEARKAMMREPYTQMWSSVARSMQEMLWDNVGESVERQWPNLIDRAKKIKNPLGSLTLDSSVECPRYVSAVDVHCMPGNYQTELTENDVFAGALYDRGAYYYVMGLMGKIAYELEDNAPAFFMEAQSRSVIARLQEIYPDIKPLRILDMGCSIGFSSLAYVKEFPDSEVYAIDVSAPLLRYGHARAEALETKVHFSQQNAENTNFPDGFFDLVLTHGVLHETSGTAIKNILAEANRLLAPGGVTMHADLQFFKGLNNYHAAYWDWDTYYNNEPFWGTFRSMDPKKLLAEAGFNPEKVTSDWVAVGPEGNTIFKPVNDHDSQLNRGVIFGASKR